MFWVGFMIGVVAGGYSIAGIAGKELKRLDRMWCDRYERLEK